MSFLYNWFFDVLDFLGLRNKRARVLFLGLDNAGKTTLTHVLRNGVVHAHEPTRHPQSEEVIIGKVHFIVHDLGGHAAARRIWRTYFTAVDGIVFMVDISDRERLQEASEELARLLADDQLQKVPLLVLGNKIDARDAVSEAQLREALFGSGNPLPPTLALFMCSVVKRTGYAQGFQWLSARL